jgi:hypothetical protein
VVRAATSQLDQLEKGIGQAVAEIVRVPPADMKNSPLIMFLLGALAISAVLSVIFCALYIGNIRELRALQSQVSRIQSRGAGIMGLANDALEYSKHDPSIDPILEWAQFKQAKSAAGATNKPAAK